jgi:hypothetical protein
MASDGAEAIFINIDGTISAEDFGRAMAALGAGDVLGSIIPPPPPAVRPAGE